MSTTAIILVTYNGWEMTKACLLDLPKDDSEFVIAIADNNSSDGTVENLRKEFPYVHIYPMDKNLGFGAANNAAIRGLIEDGVKFENICLLNNDTRLSLDAIPRLKDSLEKMTNQGKFILTPTILNTDGTIQPHYFCKISSLQFLANSLRGEVSAAKRLQGTPQKFLENYSETHWASAICWIFKRSLYETILSKEGCFFDENLFMYYEDFDLAMRVRDMDYRFLIDRNISITHLGGGSSQGNLSRALQHDRSQKYVFKKHNGLKGLLLSKSFRFIRSLLRIAVSLPLLLLGKKKLSYLKIHWALLKESLL